MLKWIDRVPLYILAIVAIPLALAPFPIEPESHLLEKLRMLAAGQLTASIDIFDLLLHGIPSVLLIIKLFRQIRRSDADKGAAV